MAQLSHIATILSLGQVPTCKPKTWIRHMLFSNFWQKCQFSCQRYYINAMSPLGPVDHPVAHAVHCLLYPSVRWHGICFCDHESGVRSNVREAEMGMKRSHGSETLIPTCLGGSAEESTSHSCTSSLKPEDVKSQDLENKSFPTFFHHLCVRH